MRCAIISGADKKVLLRQRKGGGDSDNQVLFLLLLFSDFPEPKGFVRPQLISRTIDIRVSKLNETAVAFCPAQSFPVPLFR
jgi:hypothetical protein